jgi:hypothetical protein
MPDDVERISCSACREQFSWDDAYHQRNTPGAAPHNPPGIGDFRPRVFCPGCGSMIAEWDMDQAEDRNRWRWTGENAQLNGGRSLPKSSLVPWGHPLTNESAAPFETTRIDVANAKTVF